MCILNVALAVAQRALPSLAERALPSLAERALPSLAERALPSGARAEMTALQEEAASLLSRGSRPLAGSTDGTLAKAMQTAQSARVLPEFTEKGLLPPGEYFPSWDEFVSRFGINQNRLVQLAATEPRMIALKEVGAKKVSIGGSFVTAKPVPGDVDGFFDPSGIDWAVLKRREFGLTLADRHAQKRIFRGGVHFDNRFTPQDPAINRELLSESWANFQDAQRFFSHSRPTSYRPSGLGKMAGVGAQDIGIVSFNPETLPSRPIVGRLASHVLSREEFAGFARDVRYNTAMGGDAARLMQLRHN